MKKFKLRKTYEGAEAVALIKDLVPRPDLDNAVLSGTYFESDDGKIINAYTSREDRPDSLGFSTEGFPRFCAFSVYNSEKEFWERIESVRQSYINDGRVPRPLHYHKETYNFLGGNEASRFLEEHEDLGVGIFSWIGTDKNNSYKNDSGQIIIAHVWPEGAPAGAQPGLERIPGPWIQMLFTYESEAHIKEWRDYYLDKDDGTKKHLLYPYLLHKPNWPEELSQWQAFLAGKLKIPIAQLDFSLESCDLLEAQRQKLKISYKRYLKDFFASCLGYLYEVARRHKNGTWEMRPAPAAPTVFEPFIKLEEGGEMHFFVEYWDWVYENYENFSLSAVAQMAVEDF